MKRPVKVKVTYELEKCEVDLIRDILNYIPYKQIADKLGITVRGVRWQVSRLYGKVGIDTRKFGQIDCRVVLLRLALKNKIVKE